MSRSTIVVYRSRNHHTASSLRWYVLAGNVETEDTWNRESVVRELSFQTEDTWTVCRAVNCRVPFDKPPQSVVSAFVRICRNPRSARLRHRAEMNHWCVH